MGGRDGRVRLVTAVMLLAGAALGQTDATEADVRVMSFNIRYGTAGDGDNHWDRRKPLVLQTIRAFAPDLLGTQETLDFQRDYLATNLPDYVSFGVGRDDGANAGEMTAVFYKRQRYEQVDGGHFWLSRTPEVPGSKSWDSSLTRMCTWVKLRDRVATNAPPVLFFNTHFDHQGTRARLESARLLRARAMAPAGGGRVIVTGDFNCGEESAPYVALFGPLEGQPATLADTYRVAHPARTPDECTFHSFRYLPSNGPRIDWIGASRDWKVGEVRINRTPTIPRPPSDHFPVEAVLQPNRTSPNRT